MPSIRLSYLICATPRAGSNFLCEVLRSARIAGCPDDYFWNPPFWFERWGVSDFRGYLARILREGTTPNGVFGVKMMWDYLDELLPQFALLSDLRDAHPPDVLASVFPNLQYVWLTRRDKVRQAISYYRALETKIWRSTDTCKTPLAEPGFNFQAIESLVRLVTWEDQAWQDYFQGHGIEPLVVGYEDLAPAPEDVAGRVLGHLGISPPAPVERRRWQHQRQADALSDAWARRYYALAARSLGKTTP